MAIVPPGTESASKAETKRKVTSNLPRGVYEKIPDSKDYWIRYADDKGRIRRQHIGKSLAAAKELVEQRRTEVRLGRFNPESVGRRKPAMTVKDLFEHYRPTRIEIRNKGEDQRYAQYWSEKFGHFELHELGREELDRVAQTKAGDGQGQAGNCQPSTDLPEGLL